MCLSSVALQNPNSKPDLLGLQFSSSRFICAWEYTEKSGLEAPYVSLFIHWTLQQRTVRRDAQSQGNRDRNRNWNGGEDSPFSLLKANFLMFPVINLTRWKVSFLNINLSYSLNQKKKKKRLHLKLQVILCSEGCRSTGRSRKNKDHRRQTEIMCQRCRNSVIPVSPGMKETRMKSF